MKRKEARERTNPKTRDEKTRKNKKLTVSEYGLETHAASRGYRSVRKKKTMRDQGHDCEPDVGHQQPFHF